MHTIVHHLKMQVGTCAVAGIAYITYNLPRRFAREVLAFQRAGRRGWLAHAGAFPAKSEFEGSKKLCEGKIERLPIFIKSRQLLRQQDICI